MCTIEKWQPKLFLILIVKWPAGQGVAHGGRGIGSGRPEDVRSLISGQVASRQS